MNILIVNDDGYRSEFTRGLIKIVSKFASCYAVLPSKQQSGKGHGMTFLEEIEYEEIKIENTIKSYKISGLPADCTKLGILLFDIKFDYIISGINYGPNLGRDNLYSGTVSAALEGSLANIKSIALSSDVNPKYNLFYCVENTLNYIMDNNLASTNYVLNINFPEANHNEIKGYKFTKLGIIEYSNDLIITNNIIRYNGKPIINYNDDQTDIYSFYNGYISITPILKDRTDYIVFSNLLNKK